MQTWLTLTHRLTTIVVLSLFVCGVAAMPAMAGSPHFIFCEVFGATADSITVTAKEAGLGDEDQIVAELRVTGECVNPGGNKPSADNKDEFVVTAVIPVQNGKANYTLTATAVFQPECSPPMSVVFSNPVVVDLTNGISCVP